MEKYEANYFDEEHRNWFLHPNLVLYEKLSRIILAHRQDASVLDVGCGNGSFLRYLRGKSNSLSLTGIDIAPNDSVPGIKFARGDFLRERFSCRYDVLVSLAVIEHVPNITLFAERLHELCAPGGLVITMTVDEDSLIYGASRTLQRVGYSVPLKRLYSKHHLNHFSGSSLKRLLERQALPAVHVIRHNSPMAAVDIPRTSPLSAAILRTGVWAAFQLGQLTGKTMLQTIVSRRAEEEASCSSVWR